MDKETRLLEMIRYPAMRPTHGLRVDGSGRYFHMRGQSGWTELWTFTEDEMAELRQAIADAGLPELESHDEPQIKVMDGTTVVWKVFVHNQKCTITLPPGAHVPALDSLHKTLTTLRKLPPEKSIWHVWQPDGSYRDFTVNGAASAVPALQGLIHAIFIPPRDHAQGELAVPHDTLLVRTEWITQDSEELTLLYADGHYTREANGEIKEDKKLTLPHVRNVLRSINDIDWSTIPDTINVP